MCHGTKYGENADHFYKLFEDMDEQLFFLALVEVDVQ